MLHARMEGYSIRIDDNHSSRILQCQSLLSGILDVQLVLLHYSETPRICAYDMILFQTVRDILLHDIREEAKLPSRNV